MKTRVIGIGEVLWDLLPGGAQLGGAPANFAYHARALGAEAAVVSRVGTDRLGDDLVARLGELELPTQLIQRDEEAPTGTVTVQLEGDGVPRFTIHEGVAWDRLQVTEAARRAMAEAEAVCFGSLAQRCEPARGSIRELVGLVRPGALRVFDINLRQHFHSRAVLEDSLRLANVLKLNDEELPGLARLFGLAGGEREQLVALAARFELAVLAFTRGPRGSLLLRSGQWSDHPGLPVSVRDTVGAGDAFTAAMSLGLLAGWDLDEINAQANAVARHVCSCAGATPPLPHSLTSAFLRS